VSLCHSVPVSPCHCITVSLCPSVTVSLYGRSTISLVREADGHTLRLRSLFLLGCAADIFNVLARPRPLPPTGSPSSPRRARGSGPGTSLLGSLTEREKACQGAVELRIMGQGQSATRPGKRWITRRTATATPA